MNTESQLDALIRENARLRGDLQTIATRISHDLRTPLGGIMVGGEVLKEVLQEKDPDSVPLLDSVLGSGEEMSRLIKRISFVVKASAQPRQPEIVDMGKVVADVLQGLERSVLSKKAMVDKPAAWPEVRGVPAWLDTIWWNLFTNALQHGGPHIKIGWKRKAGEIRFWISDDGPGVAEMYAAKLFQTFDSLHGLNSTRGLGLSIVQRLVELQGGKCGYEPNAGAGAGFFFTLPADDTADYSTSLSK